MINIKKGVRHAEYTTFKIGGKAKYFFIAENKNDVIDALKWAKDKNEKVFVLGGGSNVLFLDNGFDGLVIKIDFKDFCIIDDKNIIKADAGVKIRDLIALCLKNSFEGLEWASGIPSITVGGAVFGNAGAFGQCMGDIVKNVEIFNIKNSQMKILKKEECGFNYRDSVFKKRKECIILSVELEMKKGDKKDIEEKIKKTAKFRSEKQPLGYPNAGSIFKNANLPVYAGGRELESQFMQIEIPTDFKKTGVIPAGWLIEQCGLKCKKIGGAMISEKHSNIIINLGNATAKDVLALMEIAEMEVKKKFGIKLEREIEVVE